MTSNEQDTEAKQTAVDYKLTSVQKQAYPSFFVGLHNNVNKLIEDCWKKNGQPDSDVI